jgi:hypothetical protein
MDLADARSPADAADARPDGCRRRRYTFPLGSRWIILKPVFEIADGFPPAYWNPFCRLSHRSRQPLAVVYPHKRLLPTRVKLLIESPVQEIAKAHAGINPDLFAAALMGIAKRFMRTNESETTSAAKFDPEPRLADHTYARDVFRARCKLPMDDAPPRRVA